jgi:hypothetical protein
MRCPGKRSVLAVSVVAALSLTGLFAACGGSGERRGRPSAEPAGGGEDRDEERAADSPLLPPDPTENAGKPAATGGKSGAAGGKSGAAAGKSGAASGKSDAAGAPASKKRGLAAWRYRGERGDCLFVYDGECFATRKAACSAAGCGLSTCKDIGSAAPPKVGCPR